MAALSVVAAAAVYGLVGGLVLPHFAKKIIAEKLGGQLGRVVVIDDLSVNPYTLDATVKGLRILERDGRTVLASFDQLDVDGSVTSIYHFAPVADAVTVSGLKVNLVRDGESHYNVTDVLQRLAAAPKPAKPAKRPQFSLSNIRITNGRVDFDDRPKGTKHEVSDIEIAIPFVSNLPTHLKEFVQPRFSAKVNGSPIRLTGETLPFENSLRTHVSLDLDALDVPRYAGYSPTALPVKIDAGKLDAHLSVRFTQTAGKEPSVDVAGTLGLRDVRLSAPEEPALARFARVDLDLGSLDPLAGLVHVDSLRVSGTSADHDQWSVPAAEAKDIRIDLGKKDVRIESLSTRDGVLALERQRDGSIELPMRRAATQSGAGDSPAWNVALGKLVVEGYKVALADASVSPATTHRLAIARLEAADITTRKGAKATMSAKLGIDRSGSVDVESSFGIDPPSLDARIDARRIDLVGFRPYAEHFATVALKSANASAKGTLAVTGAGEAMRIAYTGSAVIANVASVDTTTHEDLVNWDSVGLTGVDFRWSENDPPHLAVAQVAVRKAYFRVVVTPEGRINLQQLKFATPQQPNAPVPAPEESKPRDIRIDRITFADSRLDFTDHYIKPNYSADVQSLHGSVTNLASDPASRGVVDVQGSFDQASPVVIAGTVNPLSGNLFLDIAARGQDIELPRFTTYSERYAGYGISQGKLTFDVKYHVENGKLDGRNKILIDQLAFGQKVESPDATKLPVLFAVNLLKDSKGAINLQLPISGSLQDPQFAIGDLISQVVAGLLKKALTSPFSLLTAAAGGDGGNGGTSSGEDLAFVDFAPGRDDIAPAGGKKLDTLAKALLDRPAIRIELDARVDAGRDLQALKRAALLGQVKEAKREALAAAGKPAPAGSDVTIDAAEYPRLLKAVIEREAIAMPAPKEVAAKEVAAKEGAAKQGPKEMSVEAMEALLLEHVALGPEALDALARRRSEQVKSYLVGKEGLPAERVLVAAAPQAADQPGLSRVVFTLR